MASKIFARGVPYAEALTRLEKAFPDLKDGDLVTHEQLEQIIGEPRGSNRYRGTLSSWRRQLRRRGYWPSGRGRAQGVGLMLCTPRERQAEGVNYAYKALKSSKVAVVCMEGVDTTAYDQKEKNDYERARAEIMTIHAGTEAAVKRIMPPPVKPPLRLATPEQVALVDKPAPTAKPVPPPVQSNVRLMRSEQSSCDGTSPPGHAN
jgi:hypothetical protein